MKKKKDNKSKEKTLRELAEKAQIHPMLPTKYSAVERNKLKEFERKLLSIKIIKADDTKENSKKTQTQRECVISILESMIDRIKNGEYLNALEVRKLLDISAQLKKGYFEDEKNHIIEDSENIEK